MKILKLILNILISFILMVCILLTTVICILDNYSNKEKFLSKLDELGFYTSVYEEIKSNFENYIYQSGLELDALDSICSEEKVKEDICKIIDSFYTGEDVEIDTTAIHENLDNAINEYVSSQNRKLSKEEEENIDDFEELIEDTYKENIEIYTKIESKLDSNMIDNFKYVSIIKKYLIIATVVTVVLLCLINIKNVGYAFSYAGISLLSSGALLIFGKYFINSKIDIDNVVLLSEAISNLIRLVAKEILDNINIIGFYLTGFGAFFIIMTSALIKKKDRDIQRENLPRRRKR